LLVIGVGLAVRSSIGARRETSLGRVAALALGAEALVVGVVIVLTAVWLDQPAEDRCGARDGGFGTALITLILAAAAIGGFVLGAALADRKRQGGALVWHLLAIPSALVLPYVAGFTLMIAAFSCLS
jgi:hypothetical protein